MNSHTAASIIAILIVTAPEPTEVANAFATSFAPMPNAVQKQSKAPRTTTVNVLKEKYEVVSFFFVKKFFLFLTEISSRRRPKIFLFGSLEYSSLPRFYYSSTDAFLSLSLSLSLDFDQLKHIKGERDGGSASLLFF